MAFFFLLVIFQSVWFCTTINMDSIMTTAANSVVYKKLPTCNITCTYCVDVTNLNICGACPTNLNLVNNSCIGNVANYYDQFFMDAYISNSLLNSTGWTISNNTNLIFNSCFNTYVNFEVLGLFNINQYVIWKKIYNNQIESSYVKFRALFYLNPITFIASINNILVLNNTPNSLQISGNYTWIDSIWDQSIANSTQNYQINCTFFDNASYVDYYKSFTSDIMSSKTFDIVLNISTSSTFNNFQSKIWGIREVIIVSVKCTTCISPEIIQKARIGGILLGIFVGSLILLIIPIYLINLYNIKRKNEIRNQPHFRVSKNIYKNIYLYPEQD